MLKKIFSITKDNYSNKIIIHFLFIKITIKDKKKTLVNDILKKYNHSVENNKLIYNENIYRFFLENKDYYKDNKMKLTIILFIDNYSENTEKCLRSILNQTLPSKEIIIVGSYKHVGIKSFLTLEDALKNIDTEYIAFADDTVYFNLEAYEILMFYSMVYKLDVIAINDFVFYVQLYNDSILDFFMSNCNSKILHNRIYNIRLVKEKIQLIKDVVLFNFEIFKYAKSYINIPIALYYENLNIDESLIDYKKYIDMYLDSLINIINQNSNNTKDIYKFYSYNLSLLYNIIYEQYNKEKIDEVLSYLENRVISDILNNLSVLNHYVIMKNISSNIINYEISNWFENNIYLKIESINLVNFINAEISNNTVLVSEFNISHGEVIPGIVKYFLDLNYNVDILLTNFMFYERAAEMFETDCRVKVFVLDLDRIKKAFYSNKIKKYKHIFITSYYIYNTVNNWPTVLDYVPKLYSLNKNTIIMQHHLDLVDRRLVKRNKKVAVMHDLTPYYSKNYINPHYFGIIENNPKNSSIVKFIVMGSFSQQRRNYFLLFDALKYLLENGISNFHLTLVGTGKIEYDFTYLRDFITVTGRLSYTDLYKKINSSDFILPMLDPENKAHDRYIKDGVSGTFQLVYGFNKLCIVNSKFAQVYWLNEKNSILYEENKDLIDSLKAAIEMTQEEYSSIQNNLKDVSKELYKNSLENLMNML